jgi:hypothetical protein
VFVFFFGFIMWQVNAEAREAIFDERRRSRA